MVAISLRRSRLSPVWKSLPALYFHGRPEPSAFLSIRDESAFRSAPPCLAKRARVRRSGPALYHAGPVVLRRDFSFFFFKRHEGSWALWWAPQYAALQAAPSTLPSCTRGSRTGSSRPWQPSARPCRDEPPLGTPPRSDRPRVRRARTLSCPTSGTSSACRSPAPGGTPG